MLRTDYILRMVEQLQRALAQIVARRQAGDHLATAQLIDATSEEVLGLGFTVVATQPVAGLLALFTSEGELDPGRAVVAGELLAQAAALHATRGDDGVAADLRRRGLAMLLAGYRVLPGRERTLFAAKALDLASQLAADGLDDTEQLALVRAAEAAGRYDRAEDLLFPLVDDRVPGALELGLALYAELLGRKDEELEQGGLPRNEVEQGLRELRERQSGHA